MKYPILVEHVREHSLLLMLIIGSIIYNCEDKVLCVGTAGECLSTPWPSRKPGVKSLARCIVGGDGHSVPGRSRGLHESVGRPSDQGCRSLTLKSIKTGVKCLLLNLWPRNLIIGFRVGSNTGTDGDHRLCTMSLSESFSELNPQTIWSQ